MIFFWKQYYSPLTLLVGKLDFWFFFENNTIHANEIKICFFENNTIHLTLLVAKKIRGKKKFVTIKFLAILFWKQYYSTNFVKIFCRENFFATKIFCHEFFATKVNSIVFQKIFRDSIVFNKTRNCIMNSIVFEKNYDFLFQICEIVYFYCIVLIENNFKKTL